LSVRCYLKYLLILCMVITRDGLAAVPEQRLAILTRGANVTYVFEQQADLSADLSRLGHAGFRHVRVFVDQDMLIHPSYLAKLDALVNQAVAGRLGIILCMISKQHPWTDTTDVEVFWTSAWRQLATRYRSVSPSYLYFEIANEPGITDGDRWQTIQERLLHEIRSVTSDFTILLTGSPIQMVWSLPDKPSNDPNVVYTWHLYQPLIFTTQGAAWTTPPLTQFAGLIYPPDRSNIEHLTNARTERELADYERSGAQKIAEEVNLSSAWSREHHIPVMVTEFGVVRDAPLQSRLSWLREARVRIEAANQGWTIWEYKGGFGIEPFASGSAMSSALGLGE
jgi:endoglucanase